MLADFVCEILLQVRYTEICRRGLRREPVTELLRDYCLGF
jgi:hypothetical protein